MLNDCVEVWSFLPGFSAWRIIAGWLITDVEHDGTNGRLEEAGAEWSLHCSSKLDSSRTVEDASAVVRLNDVSGRPCSPERPLQFKN